LYPRSRTALSRNQPEPEFFELKRRGARLRRYPVKSLHCIKKEGHWPKPYICEAGQSGLFRHDELATQNQDQFVIMKKLLSVLLIVSALAGPSASAATYLDSTGETIFGGILDISSVEVNNTATALTFKINLLGDPVATTWGKYLIGIDSTVGGDPVGNGWAKPIGMSSGMDYFVGSWVDSGNGAEIRNWTGAAWNLQSATYNPNPDALAISKDVSSVTLMFDFTGLGLTAGSGFTFDVYTSGGGGDGAIDALGSLVQTIPGPAWTDYYNSGANVLSYTITAVPEPATGLMLGLGGLLMLRRAPRRNV
jgi:hypothetical protein